MNILADRSDHKWIFVGAVDTLPPVLSHEKRVSTLEVPRQYIAVESL